MLFETLEQILIALYLGLTTFINIVVPISGSAVITSILAIITDPQRAIGIATFFFFTGGIFRIWLFRKEIVWIEVKRLLPASIIFALIGIYFSLIIDPFFLFILILLFTIYFFYKKIRSVFYKDKKKESKNSLVATAVGALSGFLQGTGLAGSEIRNSYLFGQGLKLTQVHGTTATVAIFTFFLGSVIRFYEKAITLIDIYLVLLVLPIQVFAMFYGKKVLHKLSAKTSNYIILTVMLLSIIGLIVKLVFY